MSLLTFGNDVVALLVDCREGREAPLEVVQEESLTDWPEKFLLLPIRTDCLRARYFSPSGVDCVPLSL